MSQTMANSGPSGLARVGRAEDADVGQIVGRDVALEFGQERVAGRGGIRRENTVAVQRGTTTFRHRFAVFGIPQSSLSDASSAFCYCTVEVEAVIAQLKGNRQTGRHRQGGRHAGTRLRGGVAAGVRPHGAHSDGDITIPGVRPPTGDDRRVPADGLDAFSPRALGREPTRMGFEENNRRFGFIRHDCQLPSEQLPRLPAVVIGL
ncbi:hypothetical protein [Mycobacterium saskatchewanense]|uniref:hypothetical protein n=1 Tax=Mycobacterium saskatchewanense TaxID=220927 RepID=UPI001302C385|nr:hypothetical protein [Mycobacterium saskatchewanense]